MGGLEIEAIPLATAISDYAFATQPPKTYDTFIVRKHAKKHGLGKRIEVAIKANDRVLVVDDVLTHSCKPSRPPGTRNYKSRTPW